MVPNIYGENMFDDIFGDSFLEVTARCSASTREI